MSDYISRESVHDALAEYVSSGFAESASDLQGYTDKINTIPSADVRENIHATWEETSDPIDSKYGKHNYICPKCFRDPLYFVGGTEDWWCIDKPHYCPNCGADMREPKPRGIAQSRRYGRTHRGERNRMTANEVVDGFVSFLITENCQGCTECMPQIDTAFFQNFACKCEGEAKWFMDCGKKYLEKLGEREDKE